jgi:hypothetical protein
MHQPSCDVDTLYAMLCQVLTDDKQHSAIIFKAKDTQTKELLVAKYKVLLAIMLHQKLPSISFANRPFQHNKRMATT